MSTVEEHPLYAKLQECIELSKKFKSDLYPKNLNAGKHYPDEMVTKAEINAVRTSLKGLQKNVVSLLKIKNEVAKQTKSSTNTSLLKLKPELAAFIGTQESGFGDMYVNTLLTQWFTNYFYVNKLDKGQYIVPNKQLINLFKPTFVQLGIVDASGNLLSQGETEDGDTILGFRYIRLQQLFKNLVVTDPDTHKRVTVNCEDPKMLAIIAKEKEFMARILEARHEINKHKDAIAKLTKDRKKAEMYGDKDQAAEKEAKHSALLRKAKTNLQKVCTEARFPMLK